MNFIQLSYAVAVVVIIPVVRREWFVVEIDVWTLITGILQRNRQNTF